MHGDCMQNVIVKNSGLKEKHEAKVITMSLQLTCSENKHTIKLENLSLTYIET